MKLVFIAIFSVILLVVCEPQQDVIGDGEAPGLYYNFGKRYGWNFDNRHDENNRYEKVDRSYSLDLGRDTKKEHDSREQSGRRDSDRGPRLDHDRYNKDDSESGEKNNHRDSDHGQRLDRGRDTKKEYNSREQSDLQNSDRDQRPDQDRYNKEDKESREKNYQRDSDHGQRLGRGRDTKKEYNSREQSDRRNSDRDQTLDKDRYNKEDKVSREKNYQRDSDLSQKLDRVRGSKNNDNSREQTYHRESENGRDDHRGYEHNHQRNDKHRDKQNGSSEYQRDNKYPERRNHNYKYNYENQKNDRQHDRNYNESYDKVDNRGDKTRDDSKNRDYSREDQNYNSNQDKHRNKDNGFENKKDNKSRERNNEHDRNQGYGNEHRSNDRIESNNYKIKDNRRQFQKENDRQRENVSKERSFERQDKDKLNKHDSGNYNYGSIKNQNKNYKSVNIRHQEGQPGILQKDKESYGHVLENSVQKADYNFKEQDKDRRKQNPSVITEGYIEYKKDDRNPPYRYSYIESLITAPMQNEKQDHPTKQVQEKKKDEVIEIQGIVSKNKDLNDKEVKVDVIVKKKYNTQGKVHESIQNLDHKQVNLEEGIHIHKILNKGSPEKDSITLKPQAGTKHEKNNIGYGQGNYGEKNYREGYNNHIQGKKDLLGGIELLSLIGNIGQEFKEQVIERIPGYHLIHSLEHRGQKSGSKQPYNYNLDMKGPKIDLEVYRPDFFQNEEKEKKVEKIQEYSEIINKGKGIKVIKEIDIYANTKGKERKENDQQGEKKAVFDYSISHKPVSLGDKNKNKYIENKDYEYRLKIDEGQKRYKPQEEREYNIYGNVNQKDQGNYNQQNSGNQVPNYLNQQSRDDQGLGYQGLGYVNQNNRGYTNLDLSQYQDQGYWNQQYKINQVEPDHKNKQNDEKYIFQYTIGNNLEAEQAFGKPGPKQFNIPHFLPYVDRSQGLNIKQGNVYRQGLENRGDDNLKYNDYRNQHVTKVNNGYSDLSYFNKGNPDYIPKYNQGIIGPGYDAYQAQHYPIPELVNTLTQQILASVGKVQDFYNQNYTNSLLNWSNQNEGYNVNPYLADYSYPEPYYKNNYQRSYTKPGYDSSYQGSNKEYTYQYQLPYSSVFARVGIPY